MAGVEEVEDMTEAGNMAVVEDMTGIKNDVRKDKESITTTRVM